MRNKISNIIKKILLSSKKTKLEKYYKEWDSKTPIQLKEELFNYEAQEKNKTLTYIINGILVASILAFFTYIFTYIQNLFKTNYAKNPEATIIIFQGVLSLTITIIIILIIIFALIRRESKERIIKIKALRDYMKEKEKESKEAKDDRK
ncbi:hypothetical protein P5008_04805 [Helcococcus ovis]